MNPPKIEIMASGNLSLTITKDISWESFPHHAAEFVRRCGGIVLKRIDTPVDRMWIVLIKWRPFFLTFEDLPLRDDAGFDESLLLTSDSRLTCSPYC